jgi:DNA-directed RNA polymerase specialized sigma24 family protein
MEDTQGTRRGWYGYDRLLGQEHIAMLRQRARLMGHDERSFLEMVLERGSSFRQIAHLTAQPEGSVRRRFRRLVGRLISKEMLAAMRHPQFTPLQRGMARSYYLEGLSQQAIAQRTGATEYLVRKTLRQVRAAAQKELRHRHHNRPESSPQ